MQPINESFELILRKPSFVCIWSMRIPLIKSPAISFNSDQLWFPFNTRATIYKNLCMLVFNLHLYISPGLYSLLENTVLLISHSFKKIFLNKFC